MHLVLIAAAFFLFACHQIKPKAKQNLISDLSEHFQLYKKYSEQ